jgi:hypothetical protein
MCQHDSYTGSNYSIYAVLAKPHEEKSAKRHQGRHDIVALESYVRRMADTKRSYGSRMETV